MAGVNKVLLIGNLGRDPEVRYTTGGTPVANFTLATSEQWNDPSSGEKKERTEWHRIVVWGKQAEIAGQYLRKGKQVFVEGKLQTRSWEDTSGQRRYRTEVVANDVKMLGSRQDGQGGGQGGQSSSRGQAGGTGGRNIPTPGDEDNLPF